MVVAIREREKLLVFYFYFPVVDDCRGGSQHWLNRSHVEKKRLNVCGMSSLKVIRHLSAKRLFVCIMITGALASRDPIVVAILKESY